MTEFINEIPFKERIRIAQEVVAARMEETKTNEESIGGQLNAVYEDHQLEGVRFKVEQLDKYGQDRQLLSAFRSLLMILNGEDNFSSGGIWLPSGEGLDFARPLGDYYYKEIIGEHQD